MDLVGLPQAINRLKAINFHFSSVVCRMQNIVVHSLSLATLPTSYFSRSLYVITLDRVQPWTAIISRDQVPLR